MKTILFVSLGELLVTKGGIHRVTDCLMNNLGGRGYRCLYLFSSMNASTYYTDNIEDEVHKLLPCQVKDYIIQQKVDVVVDQQGVLSDSLSKLIAGFNLPNIKYITVFHNSPSIYDKTFTLSKIWYNVCHYSGFFSRFFNLIRLVGFPIWKRRALKGAGKMFAQNYNVCDKCVMLSANEYPILSQYLGHEVDSKCVTIPNPLTFDKIEDYDCLKHKEKKVLIVSRLNNFEKRLDRALKIWKMVEDSGINDWHLYIVGWGLQEKMLCDLAKKLKLRNVHFEGRKPSEPYYRDSSIFMLTSAVEGWGLTLTESMQSGAVPLAFDSYPALRDIMTDGYEGFIILDNDISKYAHNLMKLIKDKKMREKMARNGLVSCRRFEKEKIVNRWVDLIESL